MTEKRETGADSWIPKKPFGNDPMVLLERKLDRNQEESEKTINNLEFLAVIKMDIFEQVEIYLLEKHGENMLPRKMGHFNESWGKFYERYGNVIIIALGELTDEIEFLNHEGYIDKYKLGKQIESVSKRLGL